MPPSLQLVHLNKEEEANVKTFDDVMASLYLNQPGSFMEIEEKIKLPYWKRFSYFYSMNVGLACLVFLPNPQHLTLFALSMTLPAVGGLILASDKKSSAQIFNIFSFTTSKFQMKAKLTKEINLYKENVAIPILKIKSNQLILLKFYQEFHQANKYCLSDQTLEEIDMLKDYLENNNYDGALDCIYNLYKKVQYVKEFNKETSDPESIFTKK